MNRRRKRRTNPIFVDLKEADLDDLSGLVKEKPKSATSKSENKKLNTLLKYQSKIREKTKIIDELNERINNRNKFIDNLKKMIIKLKAEIKTLKDEKDKNTIKFLNL